MISVDRLYELYNVISESKDAASKHETEYEEILGGVKGDVGARKITAQFISRYFSVFPKLQEKSLDALFDLCEDDDSNIRRQSITSLGVVCRGKPDLVPKVSDILAQLLQVDEPAEINCVNASIVSLLRIHVKGTLTGLFYQLYNNQSEVIRDRVLRFLLAKYQVLSNDVFTKEIQVFMFQESKKFIPTATTSELSLLLDLCHQMSVCRTVSGKQQLHDVLMAQVDLEAPISDKAEEIMKTSEVLLQAAKFHNNQVKSTATAAYMYGKVLPKLAVIEASLLLTGKPEHAGVTLSLLQLLAMVPQHAEAVPEPKAAMDHVMKALMTVLPAPPTSGAPGWEEEGGATLQFSRVECLLYSLQQLIKSCGDYFGDADKLKDFRGRLTYFSRGAKAYQKVLREAIKDKKGDELKTEESKTKLIALKTTSNITSIVKDFFHNPPAAKSSVTLSWKLDDAPAATAGEKRKAEIMADEPAEPSEKKSSRMIYAPPKAKFSGGSDFTGASRGAGRGRGRGRGSFRRY